MTLKLETISKLRFQNEDGGNYPEWNQKTLLEVADINPKNIKSNISENFLYIDLDSVKKGKLVKRNFIDKSSAPSRAQRELKENDVLFQSVRPYQQNHLYVSSDISHSISSTGFILLRAKQHLIYPKYLYQFLYTKNFRYKVDEACTGTSYPSITGKELGGFLINLPSLAEQRKIASFLGLLDDGIELQQERIKLLKTRKQGYVQQIFSRKTRFQDENGDSYPDWQNLRIDSIGIFSMGFTPETNNSTLWVGCNEWLSIAGMKNRFISEGNKKISDAAIQKKKPFEAGTLIMSFKLSIGKLAILTSPFFTNEAICGFEFEKNIDVKYMYYALSNIDISSFGSRAVKGITLNSENIGSIVTPIPSFSEQKKIASFLSILDDEIELSEQRLRLLKQQKQGYMQGIFG